MMFAAFCPSHGTRVLMTRRNVIGFANGLDGPVLRWRCTCGHEGFLDRDGSHADTITDEAVVERLALGCDAPRDEALGV